MEIVVRWILPILACASFAWPAAAHRYVVLKSDELKIYSETINAFKADLKEHTVEEMVLTGGEPIATSILGTLDKNPPTAILALGSQALKICLAMKSKDVPCLYTFVLKSTVKPDAASGRKVRGISLEVSPEALLQQLKLVAPQLRFFHGFISLHGPLRTVPGLEMRPVNGTADIEKHIEESKGKTDLAFWLPPDPVLMSTLDLKRIIKASQVAHIPLIVFSEAFVRAGGFASVSINYETLGHQAAALILNSPDSANWPGSEDSPIGTYLVINRKLANEFGLKINPKIYQLMVDVVVD